MKPILEKGGIKNGETAVLTIPKDKLPGQFVLRFDYEEKEGSAPYPSERYFFINNQDLELWAQPKSINNPDSTYFQKGEIENALFATFSMENGKRKEQLGLLQNFLMGYDQPQSKFYANGMEEYENRRKEYNAWVTSQMNQHNDAFVSCTFPFQYVQTIAFKGTEKDRINSLIDHYFDGMDFKDPLLTKTADLREWMNKYVNLYGTMSTTIALRDSLFTLAGKRTLEKAKSGHPLVYGWMVDYFYTGYEGFNIPAGMKMLEPYLQDPNCLTSKRLEIEKRLQGIESIRPGTEAPDFATTDAAGKPVQFHNYKTSAPYKLVLFWSADCQHCKDLVQKLYPWYQQVGGKGMMEVFALSLDYTDTEIKAWEDMKLKLDGWKHSRPAGGINSPEAKAYYILATPVLILVDSKTNKIVALPNSAEELEEAINSK
ncbi:MAG: redoxin domain-containing protein [Bacteroidales bacterium]